MGFSSAPEDPHAPIDSALSFTRYCRERLGVWIPVGGASRGQWYKELAEEMEVQDWSWGDLQKAVDYIAHHGKQVRTIRGVLHFVHDALKEASAWEQDELHVKVAEALAAEEDERWRRRLSLASGRALQRVYEEWRLYVRVSQ